MRELEFGSKLLGGEPTGCVHCRNGAKMVLLITGVCSMKCFYCPLSEKKHHHDVIYANELLVWDGNKNVKTSNKLSTNVSGKPDDVILGRGEIHSEIALKIIDEARFISASGTGITGGDPLIVLDRTVSFIQLLKKEFGEEHHIHLYTASIPSKQELMRLRSAGLNEIRFHLIDLLDYPLEEDGPSDEDERVMEGYLDMYLKSIEQALDLGLDTGVEIPVLPGSMEVLKWMAPRLDSSGAMFLNLNELEFSPTNSKALLEQGYQIRDDVSSAVVGSEETAKNFMTWVGEQGLTIAIHFCSSKYKDAGQLRSRLDRRANNIVMNHQHITEDNTLLFGIVERVGDLENFARILKENYDIPGELVYVNEERDRVEIAPWVLPEIAAELTCPAFLIEEYPTADRLEVEREKLN